MGEESLALEDIIETDRVGYHLKEMLKENAGFLNRGMIKLSLGFHKGRNKYFEYRTNPTIIEKGVDKGIDVLVEAVLGLMSGPEQEITANLLGKKGYMLTVKSRTVSLGVTEYLYLHLGVTIGSNIIDPILTKIPFIPDNISEYASIGFGYGIQAIAVGTIITALITKKAYTPINPKSAVNNLIFNIPYAKTFFGYFRREKQEKINELNKTI